MNIQTLGSCLAAAVLLTACGGGGSGSSAVPSHSQLNHRAHGTISLKYSRSAANKIAASNFRNAKYVSPGTVNADVFINGVDASGHVACLPGDIGGNTVGNGAGATGTCTVDWSANDSTVIDGATAQAFAVELDDGTYVLAEGATSQALSFGENDFSITVNGVAGSASLVDPAPPPGSASITIAVGDMDEYVIVPSADPTEVFDNPPVVTFTYTQNGANAPTIATGTGAWSSFTGSGSPKTATLGKPDANGNDYGLTVTCGHHTSTFSVSLATGTGSGVVSNTLLSGLSLEYPAAGTAIGSTFSGSCSSTGAITIN